MLVHSVAAVKNACPYVFGKKLGRARHRVADYDEIYIHCVERFARIDERFALLHRACGDRNIYFACAEIFCRQLERRAGARAVFVKERYERFAAQQIRMLAIRIEKFFHLCGGI